MLERDGADLVAITQEDGTIIYAPAVKILNERGEFSSTQGALPPWIRPYTKYMSAWFARGGKSVQNLAGVGRVSALVLAFDKLTWRFCLLARLL